jgi:hypothetical protein
MSTTNTLFCSGKPGPRDQDLGSTGREDVVPAVWPLLFPTVDHVSLPSWENRDLPPEANLDPLPPRVNANRQPSLRKPLALLYPCDETSLRHRLRRPQELVRGVPSLPAISFHAANRPSPLLLAGRERGGSKPFGRRRCAGVEDGRAALDHHSDSNSEFLSIFFKWIMSLSEFPLYTGFSIMYTDIVIYFSVIH